MGAWEIAKLSDVCEIQRGGSPRPIESFITEAEDGINWIKIGDVAEGAKYITSTREKIKPEGAQRSRAVQEGDFLLSNSMSFGRPYILKTSGCIHDGWLVLRYDKSKLTEDYLYHVLGSEFVFAQFLKFAVGAVVKNLNSEVVRQVSIPLPSLPEQRRIAAILDQADALRAKRREALAELDKLTQSIFIEMFGDPISNPRGWTKLPLESVTSKVTDGEHLNPELSESGMPIVMAGNVLENSIDMVGAKKVSEELGDRFRRKCKPELGDLLVVSRGATIGRMCAVNTNESFCLMGSVILLKLKKDRVNTDFMSALLKQPVMRSALYKTSGSSAQQAIYLKDLKNLSLICPPLELQQKFSSKVTKIVELKTRHSDSLDAINFLFSSLQHRAFRGEL